MELKHVILFLTFCNGIVGDCVWYGQCEGRAPKIMNKLYSSKAKPFPPGEEDEAMKILRAKCPFLLNKYPGNAWCCDLKMLKTMATGLEQAEIIFSRCPTCIHNWFQHVCEFNCSPEQHLFMNPIETKKDVKNQTCISDIDIYVTREYKESAFNSCKDVSLPSSGLKAIVHACRSDKHCTPKKWFESMGNSSLPIVPFQINYVNPRDEKFIPLDLETKSCNEYFENNFPCSCGDCEASCNIPFEDPAKKDNCPLIINELTHVTLSLIIVLVCSTVLFFSWGFIYKIEKSTLLDSVGDKIHCEIENFFTKWGLTCARHPLIVALASSIVVLALLPGAYYLVVTVEPVEIWASPNSECRMEKEYFDTRFGPFYRTNQIFLKTRNLSFINWTDPNKDSNVRLGPIFHEKFLRSVYDLQMKIQNITTEGGHQLKDICFAPMRTKYTETIGVEDCTVQSIWGYLKNDLTYLDDEDEYREKLVDCLGDNFQWNCLAPYRGPILSDLAVVGFEELKVTVDGIEYVDALHETATGIILTFLLNNHLNKTKLEPPMEWEEKFVALMKNWTENEKPDFIEVAFSAERSIEDEIERESNAEIGTVVFSYLIMFFYITIALGKFRRISTLLAESKIMLGVAGIIVVLSSVLASLGFFGYLGIPTTLLTIEVIPFLVLAVGVDNIFILVRTVQETKRAEHVNELVGRALAKIGPSILLTTLSEAFCFLIGSLSSMPAVRTFALYSSFAIILNFFLQITVFISCLSLDLKRTRDRRLDVLCCVRASEKAETNDTGSEILRPFFQDYYGPFLMKSSVRVCVIMVFVGWFVVSAYFTTNIELGLDQELSVPEDSYLVDYFKNLRDLLSMGPPVYFVVKKGLDFNNDEHINAICGTVGCKQESLITYLTRAAALENLTYLVKSPSSWVDDYFAWITSPRCCKVFPNGTYCPEAHRSECLNCNVTLINGLRPVPEDFNEYMPFFLTDVPHYECPKAGRAAYAGAITFEETEQGSRVADSYFMAYHTVLRTSKDYYTALERSKNIARHLSKALSEDLNLPVEVFSYSVFYVFYEQYLTIINDTIVSLCLSLITIFGVTFILTGFDYVSSLLVMITVSSIVVDMMGLMYFWGITLNAISLVNLIVAVGIGVEFCSHLIHSFATSVENDKISRALSSISTIGHSLFSGITLTKFSGIVVLAFARSLIFRIFYFRMYLLMVLIGAAHGLVLLPVLLSYFGLRKQLNLKTVFSGVYSLFLMAGQFFLFRCTPVDIIVHLITGIVGMLMGQMDALEAPGNPQKFIALG